MLFSDQSAPDGPARDIHSDRRKGQQRSTARTAEATAIGQGGITVEGEGGVTVKGGTISAEYPSGRAAATFGPLVLESSGASIGHGLLVQADDDGLGRDIFRARYGADQQRLVTIGQNPEADGSGAVDRFVADAAQIDLHSHGTELRLHAHHGSPLRLFGGDSITGPSDIQVVAFAGGLINVQTTDNGDIQLLSDDRVWIFADGNIDADANGNISLLADGTAAFGGATGTYLQPEATGLAANMHMAADGRVFRSTSSRRYKSDIRDAAFDPDAVLQMKPRTWLPGAIPRTCPDWLHEKHSEESHCPAEQEPELPDPSARRQVGFVAEELVDLGLGDFVEFNAAGEPEAIYYDRLTAALVPLLQRQQQQIDTLTQKLDQLSTRVAGQERVPEPKPTGKPVL